MRHRVWAMTDHTGQTVVLMDVRLTDLGAGPCNFAIKPFVTFERLDLSTVTGPFRLNDGPRHHIRSHHTHTNILGSLKCFQDSIFTQTSRLTDIAAPQHNVPFQRINTLATQMQLIPGRNNRAVPAAPDNLLGLKDPSTCPKLRAHTCASGGCT
jgi:hypothetical protein